MVDRITSKIPTNYPSAMSLKRPGPEEKPATHQSPGRWQPDTVGGRGAKIELDTKGRLAANLDQLVQELERVNGQFPNAGNAEHAALNAQTRTALQRESQAFEDFREAAGRFAELASQVPGANANLQSQLVAARTELLKERFPTTGQSPKQFVWSNENNGAMQAFAAAGESLAIRQDAIMSGLSAPAQKAFIEMNVKFKDYAKQAGDTDGRTAAGRRGPSVNEPVNLGLQTKLIVDQQQVLSDTIAKWIRKPAPIT
jgi:hypothetical protein